VFSSVLSQSLNHIQSGAGKMPQSQVRHQTGAIRSGGRRAAQSQPPFPSFRR
jgi:hypothetical protein